MKISFLSRHLIKEAKSNEKIYNKMNLLESIRPEYPHPDFSLSSSFFRISPCGKLMSSCSIESGFYITKGTILTARELLETSSL